MLRSELVGSTKSKLISDGSYRQSPSAFGTERSKVTYKIGCIVSASAQEKLIRGELCDRRRTSRVLPLDGERTSRWYRRTRGRCYEFDIGEGRWGESCQQIEQVKKHTVERRGNQLEGIHP